MPGPRAGPRLGANAQSMPAQVRKALQRLVGIWEERRVFGASGSKPFREAMQVPELPRRGSGA